MESLFFFASGVTQMIDEWMIMAVVSYTLMLVGGFGVAWAWSKR